MFLKTRYVLGHMAPFALAAALCLAPLSAEAHRGSYYGAYQGHAMGAYDVNNPPEGTEYEGFHCTTSGGVVMQSSLGAGCAEWWPGCSRRPDPPPPGRRCPQACKRAYFKVRYVPITGADPYTHQRSYSSHNGGHNSYSPSQSALESAKAGVDGSYNDEAGGAGNEGNRESAAAVRDPDGLKTSSEGANGGASGGKHEQAASRVEALAFGAGGTDSKAGGPKASAAKAGDTPATGTADSAGPGQKNRTSPAAGAKQFTGGDSPLTLQQAMAMADRAGTGGNRDFSAEAQAAGAAADGKSKSNFSDPWLDYMAAASRDELVAKLERDGTFREALRRKIDDMNEGSGSSDRNIREKVEYYRKVLAEADSRMRKGGLQALKPLEKFEEFSMNGDETDREIKRLLASMDDHAAELEEKDDGIHYPLFSRVHRSLWRQLANGNIVLKLKKR
jgi:hypothetical protein